jgi:hypothetical protein
MILLSHGCNVDDEGDRGRPQIRANSSGTKRPLAGRDSLGSPEVSPKQPRSARSLTGLRALR